jgi:hypothetical protein
MPAVYGVLMEIVGGPGAGLLSQAATPDSSFESD